MTGRNAGNGPRSSSNLRVVGPAETAYSTVHIGASLRARRRAAGLTQERAAALAGLTRGAVAKLEAAQLPDPHLSTLLALMWTYGLGSIEELLGQVPSAEIARYWSSQQWQGGRPRPLGS